MTDTGGERALVAELRRTARQAVELGGTAGWAHSCMADLLLCHGRLFTPSPWPDGGPPPGEPGRCYIESVSWARATGLAYVEGLAWTLAWPTEHAWCADETGTVHDPTWDEPGAAYLGMPFRANFAEPVMLERRGPVLYGAQGHVSALAKEWMREGLPADVLADVGRPITADAEADEEAGPARPAPGA